MGKNQRTQSQVQKARDVERNLPYERLRKKMSVESAVPAPSLEKEEEVPQVQEEATEGFFPEEDEDSEQEEEPEPKARKVVSHSCKKCLQALKTRNFAQKRKGVRLKKVD